MTPEESLTSIQHLRTLCEQSVETGEFTEDAHAEIRKRCEELSNNTHYEAWAPELVLLIEDFDEKVDLTVGYPGAFGHALESAYPEKTEAYCKLLIESTARKPTGLIVGLASRVRRSNDAACDIGLDLFQSVLAHPSATISAREIAEMELEPEN